MRQLNKTDLIIRFNIHKDIVNIIAELVGISSISHKSKSTRMINRFASINDNIFTSNQQKQILFINNQFNHCFLQPCFDIYHLNQFNSIHFYEWTFDLINFQLSYFENFEMEIGFTSLSSKNIKINSIDNGFIAADINKSYGFMINQYNIQVPFANFYGKIISSEFLMNDNSQIKLSLNTNTRILSINSPQLQNDDGINSHELSTKIPEYIFSEFQKKGIICVISYRIVGKGVVLPELLIQNIIK